MINFTTNQEYQGNNIDLLQGLGTEFCTFRQAVDYYHLTGKELKGAKSCARLMKIVDKQEMKNGKLVKEKRPVYFNVFEKNHLIKTMLKNGHAPFEGTDEQEYNADIEAYEINNK